MATDAEIIHFLDQLDLLAFANFTAEDQITFDKDVPLKGIIALHVMDEDQIPDGLTIRQKRDASTVIDIIDIGGDLIYEDQFFETHEAVARYLG
jgi:hypothetical protein